MTAIEPTSSTNTLLTRIKRTSGEVSFLSGTVVCCVEARWDVGVCNAILGVLYAYQCVRF